MKDELIIYSKPKSSISEDIRTIRTNLQFTSSVDESKVILITSSTPGEGKSFISSNLAVAFSQTDEKTLLIDCDMRLGRIHKIFGISNDKGFSNMLTANDTHYSEFIKKLSIPNLYIIPRGNIPPNPSELLNSPKAREIVDYLKTKFDRIIFDGVPINGLSESLIVAGLADRVVLVTSIGYSNIDELNSAKKALEKIGAKIAGIVVNKAQKLNRGSYSNYYE